MSHVRRAGVGRLPDGWTITWTVAEGRRGRRWRTATVDAVGAVMEVLLLELDPDGRLGKLELASAAGLVSLHPEGGSLHGNVVTAVGVRHVRLPWTPGAVLLVEGADVTDAAAARPGPPSGVGERVTVPAIVVRADLVLESVVATLTREADAVRLDVGASSRLVRVDERGVPDGLRGGGDWPLEVT
jgi:hypothetical protein